MKTYPVPLLALLSSMWSIITVGLCNSIMFPSIFSMALNKLGEFTGLLCMAIMGGAIVPFAQGFLADRIGLQQSFVVPAACYVFILYFGLKNAGTHCKPARGWFSTVGRHARW